MFIPVNTAGELDIILVILPVLDGQFQGGETLPTVLGDGLVGTEHRLDPGAT